MINKQTIERFQIELGSKNPTPGGGVVAALAGSFAASLIEMVCNLTIDKKGYEKVMIAYKSKNKEKIKKSLKYAIEVPFEVRKISQELEKIAYRVSKIGNKNALSDARTAIYLARAASKSALENIKINKQALVKL